MLLKCCSSTVSRSRIYKTAVACLLFLVALLCPLNPWAQEPKRLPGITPGLTETLSGLQLGESTVHDIQSVLGPTLVFESNSTSDTIRMCYVATMDDTLISFTTEHNVMTRLQVQSDKHQYDRWDWCTTTPMSAADLTLVNGITLDAQTGEIDAILGNPHGNDREHRRYIFGLNQPQCQTTTGMPKNLLPRIVSLELEFTDSRLIHFDLKIIKSCHKTTSICP